MLLAPTLLPEHTYSMNVIVVWHVKVMGDSLHEEICANTEPFVSRERKQL